MKKGSHHTEQTRSKMRAHSATRGKPMPHLIASNLSRKGKTGNRLGSHCSEEQKTHLRLLNLGRHHTEETKEKLRLRVQERIKCLGYNNSPETRKKISLSLIGSQRHLGHTHTQEVKTFISNLHRGNKYRLGKKHTEATKNKLRLAFSGEKSYSWKGGITPLHRLIRKSPEYLAWRTKIFKEQNFTCRDCGQYSGILQVHHIKQFIHLVYEALATYPLLSGRDACMQYAPLWNRSNAVVVCKPCHIKRHTNNGMELLHKGKVEQLIAKGWVK